MKTIGKDLIQQFPKYIQTETSSVYYGTEYIAPKINISDLYKETQQKRKLFLFLNNCNK